MQKQPSKEFLKKVVMRNFVEFTRKPVPEFLQDFSCDFCKKTTRRLFLITAVSTVLVMKGELASETVNYDAKIMYQFEPKFNILRSTLQHRVIILNRSNKSYISIETSVHQQAVGFIIK